ncbi:hypothetical protein [Niastella vici]|uniref:hypothetical protein n=1 Tax=Niastella vici TaxID=1703345 RepID=UPI00117C584B|nr:hypothetical protein [Niastella vici]
MARMGNFGTGEDALIGIYATKDCNFMTSTLPYTTNYFLVSVIVYNKPWDAVTYTYSKSIPPDTLGNTPGDLTLTITQRDNYRVKGTIKGTIYRSNVGMRLFPSKFDCTFDLVIPLK